MMELSSILLPSAIKVASRASGKKRLFQDLGEMAASAYGVTPGLVAEALMERETQGPTGFGDGIALPHARVPGLDRVVGLFLRIENAMDFGAADRQPVDLVFALLAPEESAGDPLKALALVSRTMRDADVRAKLRANVDPAALHAILTEAPASRAA